MTKAGEAFIDLAYYRDTGCIVSPRCLECPLERCVEDEPNPGVAVIRWRIQKRDADILRAFYAGATRMELSVAFSVSPRTIDRIIASGKV